MAERGRAHIQELAARNRADLGFDGTAVSAQAIGSVGVIGAGLMGAAIAAEEVLHDVSVTIHDADRRVLCDLPNRLAALLQPELANAEAAAKVAERLKPSIALGPAVDCDLVVESIIETFAAKARLFAQIEPRLKPGAVLATNTSTIPVGRLAAGLEDPTRFCGLHFCHPVRQRPLVEIVRGPRTSNETIATLVTHMKALGRMPVVVQDGPGFLVNRLLLPYLGEALELLLEGAVPEEVERAAVSFGMAMGPLTMLDEIGLDTTLQAGWNLSEAYPERVAASPLLVAMVKNGCLGRKSGIGFYRYAPPNSSVAGGCAADESPAQRVIDENVRLVVSQWARSPQRHTSHSIAMRLFLPMVLEATRILEENKVRSPGDIDLAVVFGLGFPESRGGLLWWADTLGPMRIVEMLRQLDSLGPRAAPTPLLRDLARRAGRFYR
ncbi:MAG: 3-hydroxyacyl-CoA dehydrogenase NAD-binding domain-containing protein [Planctomycetota bacterium]